jgi:hypothetical protein
MDREKEGHTTTQRTQRKKSTGRHSEGGGEGEGKACQQRTANSEQRMANGFQNLSIVRSEIRRAASIRS